MQEINGVKVWGDPVDEGAMRQIENCARLGAADVALMADHHKGYAVPIGGVVAYENQVSPSGAGFDIGCGNKAVLLDMPAVEVRKKVKKVMDAVWEGLSFGMGRNNKEEVDHELFDDEAWKLLTTSEKQIARNQLGTIGGGVCRPAS